MREIRIAHVYIRRYYALYGGDAFTNDSCGAESILFVVLTYFNFRHRHARQCIPVYIIICTYRVVFTDAHMGSS